MKPAPPLPTTARRAAALLIALMAALTVWQSVASYRTADEQAERQVRSVAKALSYQVDSSLRGIDDMLADAGAQIRPANWPDPALVPFFQSRLADFPELRHMLVVGPDGRSSGAELTAKGFIGRTADETGREQLRYHRDHPDDRRMRIGDPVVSRPDDPAGIPLSRGIVSPDGRFLGSVVLTLDAGFLPKVLANVLIEEAGAAAVIRADGLFLARAPGHDRVFGRLARGSLFRDYIAHSAEGAARYVAEVDGNARIVGYQTVEHYPLVVWVGLSTRTAFADWRFEFYRLVTVFGVLSTALFLLAWLSDQREYTGALLASELERNNDDLARLVDERTRHLRKAQEEAEARARALASSNAELEQFAYVASHDLQEPLRTVTSYVQLLQRRYGDKLGADAQDFIGFAVAGTHRMHSLIKAILAYSRVSTQAEPFAPTVMNEVFGEVLTNLRAAILHSGATVSRDELPCLPADRAQMASLLQNLIGNAIKYARDGVPPAIHLSAARDGADWIFTLADNGIGIAPEYRDKIFVIFQRLHGPGTYEGTGIGLALCKKIVERHGGRIWVESEPDQGSRFRFSLPAER